MMGDETMAEMMNTEGDGIINHEQMIMMGMSGAGMGLARNTNDYHHDRSP
jgi:hypothetical protein